MRNQIEKTSITWLLIFVLSSTIILAQDKYSFVSSKRKVLEDKFFDTSSLSSAEMAELSEMSRRINQVKDSLVEPKGLIMDEYSARRLLVKQHQEKSQKRERNNFNPSRRLHGKKDGESQSNLNYYGYYPSIPQQQQQQQQQYSQNLIGYSSNNYYPNYFGYNGGMDYNGGSSKKSKKDGKKGEKSNNYYYPPPPPPPPPLHPHHHSMMPPPPPYYPYPESSKKGKKDSKKSSKKGSKKSSSYRKTWKQKVCEAFLEKEGSSKKDGKKGSKKDSDIVYEDDYLNYKYNDNHYGNRNLVFMKYYSQNYFPEEDDAFMYNDDMYMDLYEFCTGITQKPTTLEPTVPPTTVEPCPNPDSEVLKCAPTNLAQTCDKYSSNSGNSSFMQCYNACKESYCCIHDSKSQLNAPSCSKEPNCEQYRYCYIAWYKLADTIGPANYLRTEQDDTFFDNTQEDLVEDITNDVIFYYQLFGHFFDNDDEIDEGTFEDPNNWLRQG